MEISNHWVGLDSDNWRRGGTQYIWVFSCHSVEANVLYLVMGHRLVMGHYFHFVKSNKTYNNPLTIHLKKLILE